MISWIIPEFVCMPADIDETPLSGELPAPYCQRMATGKALHCAELLREDAFIVGSDTTVYINHQILGKPKDEDEAVEMLKMLNGKEHLVCTASLPSCSHLSKLCQKRADTRILSICPFSHFYF